MNIIVLGGGALGTIIAGHLCRAGEDVTLLARGDYAESYDETPRQIFAGETEGCALLIAYERLPHRQSSPAKG